MRGEVEEVQDSRTRKKDLAITITRTKGRTGWNTQNVNHIIPVSKRGGRSMSRRYVRGRGIQPRNRDLVITDQARSIKHSRGLPGNYNRKGGKTTAGSFLGDRGGRGM
jgi:hypothetical protein